jgi:hypothetical protein
MDANRCPGCGRFLRDPVAVPRPHYRCLDIHGDGAGRPICWSVWYASKSNPKRTCCPAPGDEVFRLKREAKAFAERRFGPEWFAACLAKLDEGGT